MSKVTFVTVLVLGCCTNCDITDIVVTDPEECVELGTYYKENYNNIVSYKCILMKDEE